MSQPPRFHIQCVREATARIKSLGLVMGCGRALAASEIVARRQWARKQGDGTWIPHRGITIHPEPPRQKAGTNRSEDIGYGIGITAMIPADHSSEELGTIGDWIEIIRRTFINQRLTNVTPFNGHVCISTVEHGDFAKDFDDHKYEVSSLLIRVWARETRS